MGPDNQIYQVSIETEDDLFTLADRAELDAIAARIAPRGLDARKGATVNLRARLMHAPSKAAAAKTWLGENPTMTDDDMEALTRLRDKAHHAKVASMDAGAYQDLTFLVGRGLMGKQEAYEIVRKQQAKARYEAFRLANEIILNEATVRALLDGAGDAEADDDDKARAIEDFAKDDAWETARARFRELYDAQPSIEAKAQLCSRHPLLARSVLGR